MTVVTLSTTTLSFNGVGPGQTAGFTATTTNGNPALSVVADQPGVATVTQTAPGTFSVSAVGAGTCNITVTDASGGHAGIVVTVTTFPVTVN